jgi:hypothetical protein
MTIQLINSFTNNFLSQAAEGPVENCAFIFPKKNNTYSIVNEDNSGCRWKKCVTTQAGKASKLQSDIWAKNYNTKCTSSAEKELINN